MTSRAKQQKPARWFKPQRDRKSTRLNSSHLVISYAVFCLKKKKTRMNSSHLVISYAVFCIKKQKYIYEHSVCTEMTYRVLSHTTVANDYKTLCHSTDVQSLTCVLDLYMCGLVTTFSCLVVHSPPTTETYSLSLSHSLSI